MAIDNAAFIGGLDPNLPTNQDPRAEGAGQIRAIKTALVNTFPNINGTVDASDEDFNYITDNKLQRGMIMMWNGADAPKNWALCDGRVVNGYATPDLRDRFIKGWNPEAGEKPGAKSQTGHFEADMSQYVTGGNTTLTRSHLPEIKEKLWGALDNGENSGGEYWLTGADSGGRGGREFEKTTLKGGNQPHAHPIVRVRDFDKRPAWYALAFIVYVGPANN